MTATLGALHALGIQSLVLEGGTAVHQAAWDAGVVDYVQIYVAPVMVGPDAPAAAIGHSGVLSSLSERTVRMLGPDTLIEGYVHRRH